jgi:hypothetical protein
MRVRITFDIDPVPDGNWDDDYNAARAYRDFAAASERISDAVEGVISDQSLAIVADENVPFGATDRYPDIVAIEVID